MMKHHHQPFLQRNELLLKEGVFLVSAAGTANTLPNAAMLCIILFAVLTVPVVATALMPKKVSGSLRILVYSFAAALVYIPAAFLISRADTWGLLQKGGVWLAAAVIALPASAQRERLLSGDSIKGLLADLAGILLSDSVFVLLIGTVRELLGRGSINGVEMLKEPPLPILKYPFGGVMLIVLCSALIFGSKPVQKEESVWKEP